MLITLHRQILLKGMNRSCTYIKEYSQLKLLLPLNFKIALNNYFFIDSQEHCVVIIYIYVYMYVCNFIDSQENCMIIIYLCVGVCTYVCDFIYLQQTPQKATIGTREKQQLLKNLQHLWSHQFLILPFVSMLCFFDSSSYLFHKHSLDQFELSNCTKKKGQRKNQRRREKKEKKRKKEKTRE